MQESMFFLRAILQSFLKTLTTPHDEILELLQKNEAKVTRAISR